MGSCADSVRRFDGFAWRNREFTYDYKECQHVNSPWLKQQSLLIYRVMAVSILGSEIICGIALQIYSPDPYALISFAVWGKYCTFVTMCLLMYASVRAKQERAECGWLWKVSSWMFIMSLWWEFVINVSFWCWSFYKLKPSNTKYQDVKLSTDCLVPLFALLADWLFNSISSENQHLLPNTIPVLFYTLINFGVVKGTGTEVYPGLDWDSITSFYVILVGSLVSIIIWYALCWCTNQKLKVMQAQKDRGDLIT